MIPDTTNKTFFAIVVQVGEYCFGVSRLAARDVQYLKASFCERIQTPLFLLTLQIKKKSLNQSRSHNLLCIRFLGDKKEIVWLVSRQIFPKHSNKLCIPVCTVWHTSFMIRIENKNAN